MPLPAREWTCKMIKVSGHLIVENLDPRADCGLTLLVTREILSPTKDPRELSLREYIGQIHPQIQGLPTCLSSRLSIGLDEVHFCRTIKLPRWVTTSIAPLVTCESVNQPGSLRDASFITWIQSVNQGQGYGWKTVCLTKTSNVTSFVVIFDDSQSWQNMTMHPLQCNTCTIIPCDQIPNLFFLRIVFRNSKFIKLLQLTRKTLGKNEEIEQGYPEMGIEIEQFFFKCHQFSAIRKKWKLWNWVGFKLEEIIEFENYTNVRIDLSRLSQF